jgi:hypothetical protein
MTSPSINALTDLQAARVLALGSTTTPRCPTPPGSGNSTRPFPTPLTTPTCGSTADPAPHHPAMVTSPEPPSPTWPPPAPNSPP